MTSMEKGGHDGARPAEDRLARHVDDIHETGPAAFAWRGLQRHARGLAPHVNLATRRGLEPSRRNRRRRLRWGLHRPRRQYLWRRHGSRGLHRSWRRDLRGRRHLRRGAQGRERSGQGDGGQDEPRQSLRRLHARILPCPRADRSASPWARRPGPATIAPPAPSFGKSAVTIPYSSRRGQTRPARRATDRGERGGATAGALALLGLLGSWAAAMRSPSASAMIRPARPGRPPPGPTLSQGGTPMKIVRFSQNGQSPRLGAYLGSDRVMDLAATATAFLAGQDVVRAAAIADALFPQSTRGFLEGGPASQETLSRMLDAVRAGTLAPVAAPVSGVRLHAPIRDPAKFICIGLNYQDHAAETGNPAPRSRRSSRSGTRRSSTRASPSCGRAAKPASTGRSSWASSSAAPPATSRGSTPSTTCTATPSSTTPAPATSR